MVGIPTWNDYEEGSAIEGGIENCASIRDDPISGNTYTFHIGFSQTFGTEDTVDHYEIYYSTDGTTGEQLTLLTTVAVDKSKGGTYQVTLPTTLPNPTIVYAKAVGIPSVENHMTPKPGREFTGGAGNQPVASFSTRSITFANTPVNSSSTAQLTITNIGNATLAIPQNGVVITSGTGIFGVVNAPYPGCSAAPGSSCIVQVVFAPSACQSFTGTLTVSENADASPQAISLAGSGIDCSSGSTVSPNSFSFRNVNIGSQSAPANFVFTNNTGAVVSPTITVSAQFLLGSTASCSNLANAASCTVSVTFAPTSPGTAAGDLVFSSAGATLASAALSGTGVSGSNGSVVYSAIQNDSGWITCTTSSCAGGNGGATASWAPNVGHAIRTEHPEPGTSGT